MNIASSTARSMPSYKTNTKASQTDSGKSSSPEDSMQITDKALITVQKLQDSK